MHRYLLALPRGRNRVYLSWRLLQQDDPHVGFHVERKAEGSSKWDRITKHPIYDSTNYLDQLTVGGIYDYRIRTGSGESPSEVVSIDSTVPETLAAREFAVDPSFAVRLMALGDLSNNGRYGFLLCATKNARVWILAYSHEGRLLWQRDTGIPAKGGWDGSTHHVPFLAWDVNLDGRTEVMFHTAKDYEGSFYESAATDEYLTAVDGETGEKVWEAPWPAVKPRVMMTVGHLHGADRPADIVVLDETYGNVTLTAIDGLTGRLDWEQKQPRPAGHNLDIADIDGDGVQEVICGGICYNGDGTIRWEAEPFGHTDISKAALIDPSQEGLQIWYAVESDNPGVYLVDQHGQTLFKERFAHAHYGWVARHTTEYPGLQPHTAEDGRREEQEHFPIFLPDGSHWLNLTDWQRKNFIPVHWDEQPTVCFIVRKENKRVVRLLPDGSIEDVSHSKLPEEGSYGRNLICADLIGDFRENIVTYNSKSSKVLILANPNVASKRGYSPFTDFAYRHDRSQHGSGYYIYLSPPETTV